MGLGGPPPECFVLHALRLILMQSGQRNVDELKYTIANITMNIIVSLLSQAARMSPSSMYGNESNLWLNNYCLGSNGGAQAPKAPPWLCHWSLFTLVRN